MKKLLFGIALVLALTAGAFALPAAASAHSVPSIRFSTASCTPALTLLSQTTSSITVHMNDCLAQSLGSISTASLATLLTNAGVTPGLAPAEALVIVANHQFIQGVDLLCGGKGVNVGHDLLLGLLVSAVCP